MSIALDNNRIDRVSGGGFLGLSKRAPCNSSILNPHDRTAVRVSAEGRGNRTADLCSSSSSSSIGNNSDDDGDDDDEVQSKLKGSTFDSTVDALEQALPIRRGISNFYNGKSKSFASLADAACSSLKDITKPENAYTRKRKNLLSYALLHEKGRAPLPRNHGPPKRSMKSSLSSMALGNDEDSFEGNGSSPENFPGSRCESPRQSSPWRSFSVADLQHCGVSVSLPNPSLNLMGKRNKHDEEVS